MRIIARTIEVIPNMAIIFVALSLVGEATFASAWERRLKVFGSVR
ncbi:MAG TPA: hypothetical protein VFZ22_16435 [Pyrinomonadaceae bacterium]|nr:hypothetical protein [Pyrinomonadaceae bacterium]